MLLRSSAARPFLTLYCAAVFLLATYPINFWLIVIGAGWNYALQRGGTPLRQAAQNL
jgi:hypothetical protein